MVLIFGTVVTVSDPTDPIVYLNRMYETDEVFQGHLLTLKGMKLCDQDMVEVNQSTKHCQKCNRCVNEFEHHCPYLNNCINSSNYIYFISSLMSLIVYCGLTILYLFQFVHDWLNIACLFTTVIAQCLGIFLFSWHLFMIKKNISTYSYVKYQLAIDEKKR